MSINPLWLTSSQVVVSKPPATSDVMHIRVDTLRSVYNYLGLKRSLEETISDARENVRITEVGKGWFAVFTEIKVGQTTYLGQNYFRKIDP